MLSLWFINIFILFLSWNWELWKNKDKNFATENAATICWWVMTLDMKHQTKWSIAKKLTIQDKNGDGKVCFVQFWIHKVDIYMGFYPKMMSGEMWK